MKHVRINAEWRVFVICGECRAERRASHASDAEPSINLDTIIIDEARTLQSEDREGLGDVPSSDSKETPAQDNEDKRAGEEVCRRMQIYSQRQCR